MAGLKTKPNKKNVETFIGKIADPVKRQDSKVVLDIMKKVTGEQPLMWGSSIIGFGKYHYKYASGREGDWMLTGFSPRKQNLTIYIMPGFDRYKALLVKLGKYKTSVSCLYIRRLSEIDLSILEKLIKKSLNDMKKLA